MQKEIEVRLVLAILFAYKRAQELTIKYSGSLPRGEKHWYKDKKIIKALEDCLKCLKKSA